MPPEYVIDDAGCWIWQRCKDRQGYGKIRRSLNGRLVYLAHRWFYEMHVGPIPDDLELDDLCRQTSCVNPDHLEAVTRRENVMRSPVAVTAVHAHKTHCIHGHPFDEANTHVRNGRRHCRRCAADAQRRCSARRKALA